MTIQAQILDLLATLQRDTGMGLVLITHDMGVVAEVAHRIQVQYAGRLVEANDTASLFADRHHPYTEALLAALPERAMGRRLPAIPGVVPGQHDRPKACVFEPRCAFAFDLCREYAPTPAGPELGRALCHVPLLDGHTTAPPHRRTRAARRRTNVSLGRSRRMSTLASSAVPALEAFDLTRNYSVKRGFFGGAATVKALAGVSFTLAAGETLAVVGESGSGKSTLSRLLTLIETPSAGVLRIEGADVVDADATTRARLRREIQMVFQNPYGSLNPRQTVGAALEEPLIVNTKMPAAERKEQVRAAMARVGLRPEYAARYPHMFSGGQRQRIAIARALMLRPKILVLDEPVSALDVSIRAQVLNLLADLQDEFGLAYLFVSHDLSVVEHIADRIMVIYLGHAVEIGTGEAIFEAPQHPYTRALLSATPTADPAKRRQRIVLKGEPPSPIDPPKGCVFHPRCPLAFDRCSVEEPPLETKRGRKVACWAVEG